jgi:aminoglycoside phosphotransferase (APT) family kinase protein
MKHLDQPQQVRKGEELNLSSIEAYLREHMDVAGDMEVAQFHGGHANLTYLISFGDIELVLRRPPFGKIAPGAHDMKREYRVLSKLYKVFDPAPRAFLFCEDHDIIGSDFIVIERRSGVVVRTKVLPCFEHIDNVEQKLTDSLIAIEAQLHMVDYEAADLSTLGKPEGFLERQLRGWSKRWELSKSGDTPNMDKLLKILLEDPPTSQKVSIIHNDIKFDNCQFQPDNPHQVTSIFDWDMCTLGDPLLDFATTLSYWQEPYFNDLKLPVMLYGPFPDKDYLIERYASLTGLDMSRIKWYEAFAYWKGAVIAQQLYMRYLQGDSHDERMKNFGRTAAVFAEYGLTIV